jgi:hypothetical protein
VDRHKIVYSTNVHDKAHFMINKADSNRFRQMKLDCDLIMDPHFDQLVMRTTAGGYKKVQVDEAVVEGKHKSRLIGTLTNEETDKRIFEYFQQLNKKLVGTLTELAASNEPIVKSAHFRQLGLHQEHDVEFLQEFVRVHEIAVTVPNSSTPSLCRGLCV